MSERLDLTLMMTWLMLVVTGLVMVVSAAAALSGGPTFYLTKLVVFTLIAVTVLAVLASVPLRLWEVMHKPCILIAIVLCAVVLIPGVSEEVKGSRRWIDLGFFQLQPAEVAKLLVVIYIAGYVARAGDRLASRWLTLLKPLGWVGLLCAVILLQKDFGSVLVIVTLTGGMLFLGGARVRDFCVLAIVACLLLGIGAVLEPYRVERLLTFRDPWAAAFDGGYQLTQALIAFGRGGFLGVGIGEGVQKLFYLPEPHNDFIYAVIAEELGLVGAITVLAMLGFVAIRCCRLARDAVAERRVFAGMLAYGAALLLGIQTVINVGVNTGALPTKGLTLPFVSFGGNSLVVCSALIGLAIRVHYERRRIRPPVGNRPMAGTAPGERVHAV